MVTDRQRLFIDAYCADPDKKKAATAAGYKHPDVLGAQLTDPGLYPMVCAEIDRRMALKRADCGITAQRLVQETAKVALFDPRSLFDDRGVPIPLKDLPPETLQAMGLEVKINQQVDAEGHITEVATIQATPLDKMAALRDLARLLGFGDKGGINVQINNTTNNTVRVDWDQLLRGRDQPPAATDDDPIEADIERRLAGPREVETTEGPIPQGGD